MDRIKKYKEELSKIINQRKTIKKLRAMHHFSYQLESTAEQTHEALDVPATQTRGRETIQQTFKGRFESERHKQRHKEKGEITQRFLNFCRPAKQVYDRLAPFLNGYQQCQDDLKKPGLSIHQLQAMDSYIQHFLENVEKCLTLPDQQFPQAAKNNLKKFLEDHLKAMTTAKDEMEALHLKKSFGTYSQTILKNMDNLQLALTKIAQKLEESNITTLGQLQEHLTDTRSEITTRSEKKQDGIFTE